MHVKYRNLNNSGCITPKNLPKNVDVKKLNTWKKRSMALISLLKNKHSIFYDFGPYSLKMSKLLTGIYLNGKSV